MQCFALSLFILVIKLVYIKKICIDSRHGITNYSTVTLDVTFQVIFAIYLLVDAVFMILVLRELCLMRQRQTVQKDIQVKNATHTYSYYTCSDVFYLFDYFTHSNIADSVLLKSSDQGIKDVFTLAFSLPNHVYGWVNFITYGFINRQYRVETCCFFKNLFHIKDIRVAAVDTK